MEIKILLRPGFKRVKRPYLVMFTPKILFRTFRKL